jgi:23S rRNA (cytosine1962-C5)-methyltransferase
VTASARTALAAAIDRRAPLIAAGDLDALRLVNGEGDRLPGFFVDRLADVLFVTVEDGALLAALLGELIATLSPRAIYVKTLQREVRKSAKEEQKPALLHVRPGLKSPADDAACDTGDPEILVRERTLRFLARPRDGYSPGLFLDQRDNRARARELVARSVTQRGPCAVLNTFAYTCSFSVAAAKAAPPAPPREPAKSGSSVITVTSVDLSARYLDWGRENFTVNALDPAKHEFVRGDALTFMEIAAKKGRRFDLLILDPPTFATSKQSGVFQVERHFQRLFELAARIAAPGATLLCSHNQRTFTRAALTKKLRDGASDAKRRIVELEPFAPPADFPGDESVNPASRGVWITLD